jgi:co-chaperonin GroES (HSP10)
MKLSPLRDKIVVLPEKRIKSTLYIQSAEADSIGTVMAVGPGRWLMSGEWESMPLAIGDKIQFGNYEKSYKDEYLKYEPYIEDGIRYLIMSWQDACFTLESKNGDETRQTDTA